MPLARPTSPAIDGARLLQRIDALAAIGAIDGGGCARLALTDEDRQGRDLVVAWMRDLELEVRVDAIGNIFGMTPGWRTRAPIFTGSHIDTVRTGGRYDGNYGVIAGLEMIEALRDAGITPARPLGVAVFTNEEGSRFQPDMMGSLVHAGGLDLAQGTAQTGFVQAERREQEVLGDCQAFNGGFARDHAAF